MAIQRSFRDKSTTERTQLVFGSVPPVSARGVEQTGVFAITVSANGYRPYTQSNLKETRAGICNTLQSVRLNARMQRM